MRIRWDLNFHQLTVKICLSKAQKIHTVSCLLKNAFASWQNCRTNKVQILRWANIHGRVHCYHFGVWRAVLRGSSPQPVLSLFLYFL